MARPPSPYPISRPSPPTTPRRSGGCGRRVGRNDSIQNTNLKNNAPSAGARYTSGCRLTEGSRADLSTIAGTSESICSAVSTIR